MKKKPIPPTKKIIKTTETKTIPKKSNLKNSSIQVQSKKQVTFDSSQSTVPTKKSNKNLEKLQQKA